MILVLGLMIDSDMCYSGTLLSYVFLLITAWLNAAKYFYRCTSYLSRSLFILSRYCQSFFPLTAGRSGSITTRCTCYRSVASLRSLSSFS